MLNSMHDWFCSEISSGSTGCALKRKTTKVTEKSVTKLRNDSKNKITKSIMHAMPFCSLSNFAAFQTEFGKSSIVWMFASSNKLYAACKWK